MIFEGAVTKIDSPSDGVPCGGTVQVVWDRAAVEASMDTMIGMPLNCEWSDDWFSNPAQVFTEHNERFCIGVVQKVWIEGDYLMCAGIIWKDNFPDVAYMIQNARDALGFSVEAYILGKTLGDDQFEHVTSLEFCGVCICWSNIAAFQDTFVTHLAACRNNKNKKEEVDKMEFTKEQLEEMLRGFMANVESKISASIEQLKPAAPVVDPVDEKFAKLEAANAELLAKIEEITKTNPVKVDATAIPGPTATQTAVSGFGNKDREELDKINASKDMTIDQKAQARFKLAFAAEVAK